MKTTANTLLVSSLCMLITLPVHAGHYRDDSRFMDRIERQHERIEVGVESGELTRKEVRELKKQKQNIHNMTRKFREDDTISMKERRILKKKLDKRSALIWELKHNDRYRHPERHAFRNTCKDKRHSHRHRRYQHNVYHEDNGGVIYWLIDGDDRPDYGIFIW